MYKYRRFRTSMTSRPLVTEENFKRFIVRQSLAKIEKLHPGAKRVFNRMIAEPKPLKYKLQEISEKSAQEKYEFEEPLGNTEHIPFAVARTHKGNLPVYTLYRNARSSKETVIRHVTGDIEEFKTEVAKIVSNANVKHKIGRIIITGLHAEKVKLWLRRLGF
jgi:large subunit ribosomal protein L49